MLNIEIFKYKLNTVRFWTIGFDILWVINPFLLELRWAPLCLLLWFNSNFSFSLKIPLEDVIWKSVRIKIGSSDDKRESGFYNTRTCRAYSHRTQPSPPSPPPGPVLGFPVGGRSTTWVVLSRMVSCLSGHHGQGNENRKKYFLTILSSDRFPFGYPIWSFRFQKGESFIKIGFLILMNNWTGFSSGKPKDLRATVNFTTTKTKTMRVGFG